MKIITIFNQELEISDCLGCHLVQTGIFKDGLIAQTNTMQLSLDIEIAYHGMMIISPKRHVDALRKLMPEEREEWNKLDDAACEALQQDCPDLHIVSFDKQYSGYHIHKAIIPVWKDCPFQEDYRIIDDLWNNRKDLREQNLEKVLAYKDVLTKRVNAYLMTHQQNIR